MIITWRERSTGLGRVLFTGDFPSEADAAAHCARQSISLAFADLRNVVWDGADISGLRAENSDFTGASLRNIRATGPAIAEFSACLFDAATEITGQLTHVNFACSSAPGVFRVDAGTRVRMRGCNWDACQDVIKLPVRDDAAGQVYAVINGAGWKVHAGERATLLEADAKMLLTALPGVGAQYAQAFAYLESPEVVQRKAEIEARPAAAAPLEEALAEARKR